MPCKAPLYSTFQSNAIHVFAPHDILAAFVRSFLDFAIQDVRRPMAFHDWLLTDWGPSALSSVSTYTRRFGARPVVCLDGTTALREVSSTVNSCA